MLVEALRFKMFSPACRIPCCFQYNVVLEDLSADGRMLLKWICKMWVGARGTRLLRLRIGKGGGLL